MNVDPPALSAAVFPMDRIRGVSPARWAKIGYMLQVPAKFTQDDLRRQTGVERPAALALMLALAADKLASNVLLVYHACSEHCVATRPFTQGFQPVPWRCPMCKATVEHDDDLLYEIQCSTNTPIRLTRESP